MTSLHLSNISLLWGLYMFVFGTWHYVTTTSCVCVMLRNVTFHFVFVVFISWLCVMVCKLCLAVFCLDCTILRHMTILLCDNTLCCVTFCHVTLHYFVHQGYEVLSKYVALYAANLIKDGNTLKALDLFCRYGAPANPQVNSLQQLLYQETFIFWLSSFLSLFSSTILNLVNISNSR